jgi:hypothetical protein
MGLELSLRASLALVHMACDMSCDVCLTYVLWSSSVGSWSYDFGLIFFSCYKRTGIVLEICVGNCVLTCELGLWFGLRISLHVSNFLFSTCRQV